MKIKEGFFKNPIVVVITALLCTALWGSATPFINLGYDFCLDTVGTRGHVPSIMLFAGVRFILAGLLTIIIYSIARRRFLFPKARNLHKVGIVSLFQTVLQYVFFYIGLANTSAVKGTIASGTSVFFSILVAALIFRQEKITVKKLIACVIGFAGIIIVNLNGLLPSINFGDVSVLISAAASGVSAVLTKRFSSDEDPVIISGYQFFMGGILMVIIGLSFGGAISLGSTTGTLVLLYLGMLSAVAYSLWGVLLKYNSVSKVTIFSFMTPVFGVLLSKIMLTDSGDVHIINLVLALLLVCAGIFMLNFKPKNEIKPIPKDKTNCI